MDNELEWLRSAAPPTIDPTEPTLRRARGRLVAEYDRAATRSSGPSPDPLKLSDLPTLEPRPPAVGRAQSNGTGSGRRRVVFGWLAAGLALFVAISLIANRDDRYDRPLDTGTADGAQASTESGTLTRLRSARRDLTNTPGGAVRGRVPSLVISQVFQLLDGQSVTITIFNVPDAKSLDIELCPNSTEPDIGCPSLGTHELDGSDKQSLDISIPRFTVQPATGDVVDCVDPCTIRVTAGAVAAYAHVSFKPEGELAPSPSLQIDSYPEAPADRFTVTGEGFPTYSSSTQYLRAQVCAAEPTELSNTLELITGCGLPSGTLWETEHDLDPDGRFRAVLDAPGSITTQPSDEVHRCFTDACWLVVSTGGLTAGPVLAAVQLT